MGLRQRVLVGLGAVVLAGTIAFAIGRGARERRLADLGACLLGSPIGGGEKPSERMLLLELGRPYEPRNPNRYGIEYWPKTCSEEASNAARSWLLGSADRASLTRLAEVLEDDKADIAVKGRAANEVGWLSERHEFRSSKLWQPVRLLPYLGHTPLPCEQFPAGQDGKRAVFFGKPGCTVESTETERLVQVRPFKQGDAVVRPNLPEGTSGSCVVDGRVVAVSWPDDRRTKSQEIGVTFIDSVGSLAPTTKITVTSQFEDSAHDPHRSLEASVPTVSCREGEAQIAWAWATLIGGKPHEEVAIVTCVAGRCESRTVVVHVETSRRSNCGMCKPSPDQFQLLPPTVVDLWGAMALVWTDAHTVRARVGPIGSFDHFVDQVLWYEDDVQNAAFAEPVVVPSTELALVAVTAQRKNRETRLFRVTAGGAIELLIPE